MKSTAAVALPLILAVGVAACQMPVRPDPEAEFHAQPVEEPLPDRPPSGLHYAVDAAQSEVRIVIYPDGRLGHAHVIGGEALAGEIIVPTDHHQVWLDLGIGVDDLLVDDPAWREDERLAPEMSQRAIAGTRDNMLSAQVLNAAEHPEIRIRASGATGPVWQADIQAHITLAGITRVLTVPVSVHEVAEDELQVIGRMRILQSEFGIEPFSALGGTLRIADEVLIRFRIRARATAAGRRWRAWQHRVATEVH